VEGSDFESGLIPGCPAEGDPEGSRRVAVGEFRPKRVVGLEVVSAIAAIHVLCEANPSFGTSVVNGLLAGATALSACTAFGAGSLAAMSMFIPVGPAARTNAINMGLAWGFLFGMLASCLMLFVFIARIVT
jgi:hypothetical protein